MVNNVVRPPTPVNEPVLGYLPAFGEVDADCRFGEDQAGCGWKFLGFGGAKEEK